MLDKVLARLRIQSKMNAEPILLDNWLVMPALAEGFEGAFYLVDVKSNNEIFQTGLIETVDWGEGEARELSGQRYVLGRIHHEYLDYLKEQSGASLLNYIPEHKQVPNNLYTLSLTAGDS